MTTAEAQAQFQDFNHRYFDGKLPRYRVHVVQRRITRHSASGFCNRKRKQILLASWEDNETQRQTLLHEMAHAATNDFHAAKFLAEMMRLHNIGAPVARMDIDPELRAGPRGRVTQGEIRSRADDFFMDGTQKTLRQFLCLIVYTEGYGDTQAGFQRRYPWVAKVFREAKKSARTYETRRVQAISRGGDRRLT